MPQGFARSPLSFYITPCGQKWHTNDQRNWFFISIHPDVALYCVLCYFFKHCDRFTFFHCIWSHDDVIKWKHFPRNWPFVRGIHRSGEFPTQRPVTRSFDVFFDLRLNIRLSKQPRGWWFETQSWSLWRHCNAAVGYLIRFIISFADRLLSRCHPRQLAMHASRDIICMRNSLTLKFCEW